MFFPLNIDNFVWRKTREDEAEPIAACLNLTGLLSPFGEGRQ
jgi:hypothetical protein